MGDLAEGMRTGSFSLDKTASKEFDAGQRDAEVGSSILPLRVPATYRKVSYSLYS